MKKKIKKIDFVNLNELTTVEKGKINGGNNCPPPPVKPLGGGPRYGEEEIIPSF